MLALLVTTFSMTEGASVLVDRKEAKVEKDGTYDNVTDSTTKHGGPTEEKLDARMMGELCMIVLSRLVCPI